MSSGRRSGPPAGPRGARAPGGPRTAEVPGRPSTGRRFARVVLALCAVPAVLAAWIGSTLAADRLGLDLTANRLLAWMVAAIVALVAWPLTVYAAHRQLWHLRDRPAGAPIRWGGEPTAPVPRLPPGRGRRSGRIVVLVLGAAALAALCGPQEVTLAVLGALGAGSTGRWSWALVQFVASGLLLAVMLPLLGVTDRALRRLPPDSPARQELVLRRTWYLAAAIAWVMCLVLGLLAAWMILRYL